MNPTVKIHLQNGTHFNTYMYQVGNSSPVPFVDITSEWLAPTQIAFPAVSTCHCLSIDFSTDDSFPGLRYGLPFPPLLLLPLFHHHVSVKLWSVINFSQSYKLHIGFKMWTRPLHKSLQLVHVTSHMFIGPRKQKVTGELAFSQWPLRVLYSQYVYRGSQQKLFVFLFSSKQRKYSLLFLCPFSWCRFSFALMTKKTGIHGWMLFWAQPFSGNTGGEEVRKLAGIWHLCVCWTTRKWYFR